MVGKKKLEKWLDILNYWEDVVQEYAERYDSSYYMYERYSKMIEDMYNEKKKMYLTRKQKQILWKNKIGDYVLYSKPKITKGE